MKGVRAIISVFRCPPCWLVQVVVLAGMLLMSLSTRAQEREWRFEIEVILFEHLNAADTLEESFDEQDRVPADITAVDLISPYLLPDLSQLQGTLPLCHVEPAPSDEERYLNEQTPAIFSSDPRLETTPFDFDGYVTEEMQLIQDAFAEYGFYEDISTDDAPVVQAEAAQDEIFGDRQNDFVQQGERRAPDPFNDDSETGISTFALPEPPPTPEYLTFPLQPLKMPDTLWCVYQHERFPLPVFEHDENAPWYSLEEVPAVINGVEWPYETGPYLISRNSLRLKNLVRDIRRQKNLRPLLHLGWRQEVLFGRNTAPFYRLIAGENYASQFAADGSMLLPEVDISQQEVSFEDELAAQQDPLIQRIRAALDPEQNALIDGSEDAAGTLIAQGNQDKVAEMWQLGGLFKVYLQYINRVPYLHIDANLDYLVPVSEAQGDTLQTQLKRHNFRQLRRVISRQVHYFDHPLFGMVVQIRRYQRPTPPQDNDTAPTETE